MTSLTGKAALVTGGGTGIGAAIAETFAAAGASVAVTAPRLPRRCRRLPGQGPR